MKILTLIFLFICCFFNFSCSESAQKQIQKPQSPPILEMTKELTGLWDVTGDVLELRLYENGFAEFDFVDYSKKVSGKFHKTDELKIAKQIQLNDLQMQELLNLLNGKKFQNLKESYQPKVSCIDNFIENIIVFRSQSEEKKIRITGHCENLKSPTKNFPDFPPILSELYKQIDEVKKNSEVNK